MHGRWDDLNHHHQYAKYDFMIIVFFSEFSFGLSLYHDAIFSYVNTQISSFNLFGAKKLIKLQAKTFLSKGRATFTRANSWQATVSPSRHLMKRPVPHPKISHTQTLFHFAALGLLVAHLDDLCIYLWLSKVTGTAMY